MGEYAELELERAWLYDDVFSDYLYKVEKVACWKTQKGEVIPISKMETSHIKNCIAMLERKGRTNSKAYPTLLRELDKRNDSKL